MLSKEEQLDEVIREIDKLEPEWSAHTVNASRIVLNGEELEEVIKQFQTEIMVLRKRLRELYIIIVISVIALVVSLFQIIDKGD